MNENEEPKLVRLSREMMAAADLIKKARLTYQAARDRLVSEEQCFRNLETTFNSLSAEHASEAEELTEEKVTARHLVAVR